MHPWLTILDVVGVVSTALRILKTGCRISFHELPAERDQRGRTPIRTPQSLAQEVDMSLVVSNGSYTWKGYIPARHRKRIGRSKYLQKSLPCRSRERAERLVRYLDGAWPGFLQLLDETEDITDTEIAELMRNFLRLVDPGETDPRGRHRGKHLYDDLIAARSVASVPPARNQQAALEHLKAAIDALGGLTVPDASPTISMLVTKYLEERRGNCTQQTWRCYGNTLRTFIRIVSDIPVTELGRSHLREYKEVLFELPPFWERAFPGLTPREIVARNRGSERISPTTINTYLQNVGCFLNWSHQNGYTREPLGAGLKLRTKRRAEDIRPQYEAEDLVQIFEASWSYRKLQTRSRLHRAKHDPSQYHRFWLPLIALYSGLRLSEIAGLHRAEFREIDGIWVFDIRPNAYRTLKSLSAERIVPVHPKLLDLNLPKALTQSDDSTSHLWPAIPRGERARNWGGWSGYWARYGRENGFAGSRKTFHSFRHSFVTALTDVEDRLDLIADLTGHAIKSEAYGRYRKRAKPKRLLETISKIEFPISLDHLLDR